MEVDAPRDFRCKPLADADQFLVAETHPLLEGNPALAAHAPHCRQPVTAMKNPLQRWVLGG
jgi:hypothetical protein